MLMITEETTQETNEQEDIAQQEPQTAEEISAFENFLGDEPPVANPEEVSEEETVDVTGAQTQESQETEEEEESAEQTPEEIQKRTDELLAKADEEGLTPEEIAFMEEQGYEVDTDEAEEEESEEEEEEQPAAIELPEELVTELDEIYADDDTYTEELTPDQRLSFASKAIKTLKGQMATISDVLFKNPDLGKVLSLMTKGSDFESAIQQAGINLVDEAPEAGTPEYDEYIIQKHQKKENDARALKLEEDRKTNLQNSSNTMESFIKNNKITDKKKQEKFFQIMDNHLVDVSKGIISEEIIDVFYKAFIHEGAVSDAAKAGEVKGRNSKIRLKKKGGDNLPKIQTSKKEPKSKIRYANKEAQSFDNFLEN